MEFRQPNSLSRVMNQVLDQLGSGQVLTLKFVTQQEAERALTVLHEVARSRQLGIVATPTTRHQIELRRAEAEAA